MNPAILTPPYAEPVHLFDMKQHLKQDLDIMEEDGLIVAQMLAARDVVETATGANGDRFRTMVTTTFHWDAMKEFPGCGVIYLPRVPLTSVTSLLYWNTSGTEVTVPATDYTLDLYTGRIILNGAASWPATRGDRQDHISVVFTAGMGTPFTVVAATDVFTNLGNKVYNAEERVRLMNTGGQLPSPLQAGLDYYVIAGGKLSLTYNGAAIDILTAGSGTHFMASDFTAFETGRSAIKLQVARYYFNRGDAGFDSRVDNTQRAIDGLIASIHA